MKKINCNESLPIPEDINGYCGTYYIIEVEKYGQCRAMYLKDDSGNVGWYESYMSKIIKPVIHWYKKKS